MDDECVLFYKLAPDRTVVSLQLPHGLKKEKDRITMLVYAYSAGMENFELMFIGTPTRPKAFNIQ